MSQEEEDREFYTIINLFFKMMFWLLSIAIVMGLGYLAVKLFLTQ
jgi:hypothetical protein